RDIRKLLRSLLPRGIGPTPLRRFRRRDRIPNNCSISRRHRLATAVWQDSGASVILRAEKSLALGRKYEQRHRTNRFTVTSSQTACRMLRPLIGVSCTSRDERQRNECDD